MVGKKGYRPLNLDHENTGPAIKIGPEPYLQKQLWETAYSGFLFLKDTTPQRIAPLPSPSLSSSKFDSHQHKIDVGEKK